MTDSPDPPSAAVPLPVPRPDPGWGSRLRWFLAEFLVVVSGIMVALALSGWVQERRDQQREVACLRQLSADLLSSEQQLTEAVEGIRERARASARVLHRFWREDPAVDEALVEDLSLPQGTRRFRPVMGTAEALSSSGNLGLIGSDTLRAELLTYVESMKRNLDDINRFDETYYRPGILMLHDGPDLLAHVKFPANDDSLRTRPNQYERVPIPGTLADMLRDRNVYTGYRLLLTAHRNQANRYEEMLEQTRALRTKVEAELARWRWLTGPDSAALADRREKSRR